MLKIYIIIYVILILMLASGCGSNGYNGIDAEPCSVEQLEDGVYISCPDSDVFIPTPSESDPMIPDDFEDVVECKRGKGHKKHTHDKHEHCE